MWERFSEKARRAIFFAQEEAGRRGYSVVGTEHLLLGLLQDTEATACKLLKRLSVDLDDLRARLVANMPPSGSPQTRDMQLSANAKRSIDLAYAEARELHSNLIGTEHLLVGLAKNDRGVAGSVLLDLGVSAARITRELRGLCQSHNHDTTSEDTLEIPDNLRGRDLTGIDDLTPEEVGEVLDLSVRLKSLSLEQQLAHPILPGKSLAMIFEKPSLRTRVTFEVGMAQLGGHAIYLAPQDIGLGKRESVHDVAKNLERWVHGIMARTFKHSTVTELAKHAGIPVINGLSDLEHPCQALADFLTIREKKGTLRGLKLAYLGDGFNTAHSFMLLGAKVGAHVSVATPEGYEPNTVIINKTLKVAEMTGSTLRITTNPFEAAEGADVIYTDVWASMGQEEEHEKRVPIFTPYQVNEKILGVAKPDVIVMHPLPAHRGEEITDEVIDGPHSVVFDEAENRLHAQKAIMALLM